MTTTLRSRLAVPVKAAGAAVMRFASARRAAAWAAAHDGRGLVLLYHRVTPDGAAAHHVVPCVTSALLHRHLDVLAEFGEIVPLDALLAPPRSRRHVRFAITFDDDEPSHVRFALPILRTRGVPATFFLSGRALHGLAPYWWTTLEALIHARGVRATADDLGIDADTPARLAAACEAPHLAARLSAMIDGPRRAPPLDRDGIGALATAGMSIGFHTLHHPVLTAASDDVLTAALVDGRRALSDAVGHPVDLLAYPHGRVDARVARQARAAGYGAAFGTRPRPIRSDSNRFLLGRWEPGALSADAFAAQLALRLTYPPVAPAG